MDGAYRHTHNMVYYGSADGTVYGTSTDGEPEWEADIGDQDSDLIFGSSPTVVDDLVYIGSTDGNLYALETETGSVEWTFDTGGAVRSSPTYAAGMIYVGNDDRSVFAVDALTGDEEWQADTDGAVYSAPTVSDGRLLVGEQDPDDEERNPAVRILDAENGSSIFGFFWPNSISSGPTVVGDTGYVIVAGLIGAMDIAGQEPAWNLSTEITFSNSSPVVANGILYAGGAKGDGSSVMYAIETDEAGDSDGSRVTLGTLGHHDGWPGEYGAIYFGVEVVDTGIEDGQITGVFELDNRGTVVGTREVDYLIDDEHVETVTETVVPGEMSEIEVRHELGEESEIEISVDTGDEAVSTTVEVDPGELSISPGTVPDEVDAGDLVSVELTAENRGDSPVSRELELHIDGTFEDVHFVRDLLGGATEDVTLQWVTDDSDEGDFEVSVESDDGTELSETVSVLAAMQDDDDTDDADDAADADGAAAADDDGPGFGPVTGLLGATAYAVHRWYREAWSAEST